MPLPHGGLPGLMPGGGPAHFSVAGNPVRITSQGVGATVHSQEYYRILHWGDWQYLTACTSHMTMDIISSAASMREPKLLNSGYVPSVKEHQSVGTEMQPLGCRATP